MEYQAGLLDLQGEREEGGRRRVRERERGRKEGERESERERERARERNEGRGDREGYVECVYVKKLERKGMKESNPSVKLSSAESIAHRVEGFLE